jgi:type II secretory pathway component PulF
MKLKRRFQRYINKHFYSQKEVLMSPSVMIFVSLLVGLFVSLSLLPLFFNGQEIEALVQLQD